MAFYDYKCTQCNEVFTISHSINDEPALVCEHCGDKLQKQYSIAGISFKGEGFASNDKS